MLVVPGLACPGQSFGIGPLTPPPGRFPVLGTDGWGCLSATTELETSAKADWKLLSLGRQQASRTSHAGKPLLELCLLL